METRQKLRIMIGAATVFMVLIAICAILPPQTSEALPIYSRRYGVTCQTCHLIPPKLNQTGLAFQANHFNWPNNHPPAYHDGISAAPISGLITNVYAQGQNQETLTAFQTLELFASDGFKVSPGKNGGYWVDYFAATNDNQRASDLDAAFVAVPVAGSHGQWSVVGGQFAPLTYQWDAVGNLTNAAPAPFDNAIDNVNFDSSAPGVRLEYYDNRGKMTANGNYVDVGVPFDGHLTFNKESTWYGNHGVYVHAFKRVKWTTAGFLYYENGSSQFGSLIGTRHVGHYVYLLGAAATGHDSTGDEHYLSGQAEFCPCPWISLTGRYDSITGTTSDAYPTATLTVYPGRIYWLRFSAETVQQKANRSNTIYAYVQF